MSDRIELKACRESLEDMFCFWEVRYNQLQKLNPDVFSNRYLDKYIKSRFKSAISVMRSLEKNDTESGHIPGSIGDINSR